MRLFEYFSWQYNNYDVVKKDITEYSFKDCLNICMKIFT